MNIFLLIILWVFFGILGTSRLYYSVIKYWYEKYQQDYRKSPTNVSLSILVTIMPLFIIGGFITFISSIITEPLGQGCWYYKIPNKEK